MTQESESSAVPQDTIQSIAEQVLNDFLGLKMAPATDPGPEPPAGSRIFITGAWDGSVSLRCTEALGRRVASGMFGVGPDRVSDEDVQDALGELANILGGNIKPLFPAPNHLSLPFHGGDPEPGRLLCQLDMDSAPGQHFRLQIIRYEPEAEPEKSLEE